jgi:hypothetical protein
MYSKSVYRFSTTTFKILAAICKEIDPQINMEIQGLGMMKVY